MNTQAQLPDWTPSDFIERTQIDAEQKSHDVYAAAMDVSALYACAESRAHVADSYGTLKAAQAILGNLLHHMEQEEITRRRVA